MSDHRIHGINLHSRYNPQREASRYFDNRTMGSSSGVYIFIEPGEGYLTKELLHRYPEALALEIHCDLIFQNEDIPGSLYCWDPSSSVSLRNFLSSHIADYDLGLVQIVEWEPSRKAYGPLYDNVLRTVISFLQERRGNVHTTGTFGYRWLKNVFRRVLTMSSAAAAAPVHLPVLIAASGPTLASSIPLIHRFRDSLSVWALPSSIQSLLHENIVPDLIVHTDPGFYARYHLDSIHHQTASNIPLAAPLNAAVPGHDLRYVPLNTGTPIEEFVLQTLSLPSVRTIQHGTVAGTALYTALALSPLPVFFSGLDLSFDDIRGHCRPHSFERIFLSSNRRVLPLTHIYYDRSPRPDRTERDNSAGRQNFALKRYEDWFASLSSDPNRTVYRLFPTQTGIPSFIDIDSSRDFEKIMDGISENFRARGDASRSSRSSIILSEYAVDCSWSSSVLREYIRSVRSQCTRLC
ncbi:MAG: 6-hydroxymethylpterin diphosphokinase MptE-like protein, partial [Spirochaetota bacterium]|nr:6-hydroxymethylpterin diphosphokinase MptE-like protein [Spirochaetota bacterium]